MKEPGLRRILLLLFSVQSLQVACGGGGTSSTPPRPPMPPGPTPAPGTELVVIVGETTSPNFPVTSGAFQANYRGNTDGMVTLIRLSSPPQVVFSTYFGGSQLEQVRDAFIDAQGNVYVTGRTASPDLVTTSGAFQRSYGGGNQDGFVAKFSPTGQLLFCTYLGGASQDNGYSIFVDAAGFIYVGGRTSSSNFPATPGAFQTTYGGGTSGAPYFGGDMFVAKFSADAGRLVWATYIGGSGDDSLRGRIAVDSSGNVYGEGMTASADFPLANAAQSSLRGAQDGALFKLSADGSRLVYSTYFGGFETNGGEGALGGVALNGSGDAYFCGYTTAAAGFPVTPGAYQTLLPGTLSAYVARLSPTGTLVASTLLGGSATTFCQGIAVDSAGNPVVLNSTTSADYPTTPGSFQTTAAGNTDMAITKLNPNLGGLVFSTFVGGSGTEAGDTLRVELDSSGNVYFAGSSASASFPVSAGAIQGTYGGAPNDVLFIQLSADGARVVYATFFGGSAGDFARSFRYRKL